ncbi:MAG TPA: D-alanyl-lipoteichoic acid biosynthesis protein DltD [Symbiobacteriaceae bacterium]|jgi:D-alanine transfer protein
MQKPPHLTSALVAVVLIAGVLAAGMLYARGIEARYIHALAPVQFAQKNQGAAFQAMAFRQPDLLPIYGSSELNIANPYHGNELFKKYPTGFAIFPVGKAGTTSLMILQDLAAVGGDLRGKKVALSLSAPWFFHETLAPDNYAGNFSAAHATALAFSTDLSLAVKRDAARRMLQYPQTLEKLPVLRFALQQLAGNSFKNRALYWAVFPLGKLDDLVLHLQDHWESLMYIRSQTKLKPEVERKPAKLDWVALLTRAEKEQRANANNNPFGFDNNAWNTKFRNDVPTQKNKNSDANFLKNLNGAKEFPDLDLLLRAIREMGGEPLVLSMPIQGVYYDYTGVSAKARQAYYEKVREVCKPYGVPIFDYSSFDGDKYFLIDPGAHLSREGWVFYNETLDAFYHGTFR